MACWLLTGSALAAQFSFHERTDGRAIDRLPTDLRHHLLHHPSYVSGGIRVGLSDRSVDDPFDLSLVHWWWEKGFEKC